MSRCTIVMYHYVRDLVHSRYPDIKGLSTADFKEQVAFLKKHYTPISGYDLMDAVQSGSDLPPNAVLLTFDDGYMDHFTEVFPVLDQAGMSGCFFPSAQCLQEQRVLDVNKIHFTLASTENKQALVDFILSAVGRHQDQYQLAAEAYWAKCGVPSRYDPAEVVFIKRMLQRELPESFRNELVDELFRRFVTEDEAAFSNELYMNTDQLSCLLRNGMVIGSHGFGHYWLNSLPEEQQRGEIDLSLEFLAALGCDTTRWIMCYPYGGYNEATLSILRDTQCVVGLSTDVGIADIRTQDPLTLPRLNTNDLPKDAHAELNQWYCEPAL